MEPRPQRPRSASPQQRTGQVPAQQQPPEGHYDEYDQPYIAPPRTEYDYSPLDLAPSGQRRKRQLVAGAIGGLVILLIAAVSVLAFLLINNGDDDDGVDLAARETQTAATSAAIDILQTQNADASINATGTAASAQGGTETPADESAATEAPTGEATEAGEAEATEPAGEPTEAAADGAAAGSGDAGEGTSEDTAAGPDVSELETMLPPADAIPAGLDNEAPTNLDQAAVVSALGDSRTAEQNLERWGWSGNVGRAWTPTDPAALESNTVTGLFVSIHGFNSPESAAEALQFFADVLASGEGQVEGDPPILGEGSRLLTSTAEDGTVTVALYVVQGNVLYRFGATGADPQADLIALAETTLAGGTGG
jgi:hypothetical protein